MIALLVAIASALPIATVSLDPRCQFARDRDRDRDREVLKYLGGYLLGLWLGAVLTFDLHHQYPTPAKMIEHLR